MKRKLIFIIVLLLVVGFAAVSTILYINGTTKINANDDDFNVYYSNALVNGVPDRSVVTDETHLTFTTELSTLGEKYVLDYEVTNGSKNYDAELVMQCTEGNELLTVTNEFDDNAILESLQTRSGKLILELIKSNAGEDVDVTITCTIDANAVERESLGEGNVVEPVRPLATWEYTDLDNSGNISVGDIYTAANESFNVISQTEDTVTMLAQYNIGTNYKQSTTQKGVKFSDSNGWEYTPGPKEIDIQVWSTNPKTYVNNYVSYLQTELADNTITGDLITVTELKALDCTTTDAYTDATGLTCANSSNAHWLVNGQGWWTRSAYGAGTGVYVWSVDTTGDFYFYFHYSYRGVRPVITVSKSRLNNL